MGGQVGGVGGDGGAGFNSDAEQRSWDIDAGFVAAPLPGATPAEEVAYAQQAFNRSFQEDSPYSEDSLAAIRDKARTDALGLSGAQIAKSNWNATEQSIADAYSSIFGTTFGPLARTAANIALPAPVDTIAKGFTGLTGLFGHVSGLTTPGEYAARAAAADAKAADAGGRDDYINKLVAGTTPTATQPDIVTPTTPTGPKFPGMDSNLLKALIPTLKLKGVTLADILAGR
jgi:hypothetical protein